MSKLEDFAMNIARATRRGTIPWERTAPAFFLAEAAGVAMVISRPDTDSPAVRLSILDKREEVIDSIETDPHRPGPWQPWEEALNEVIDLAQDQASGISDALVQLSEAFGIKDDDIPF